MTLNDNDKDILASLVDPDKEQETKYPYDDDFLRMVLGLLLCNRFFLNQCVGLIKPIYFRNEIHQLIARILFQYYEKYNQPPSRIFLKDLVEEQLKKKYKVQDDNYRAVRLLYIAELGLVYDYYTKGGVGNMMPMMDSPEAILDRITNFAKIQAIKSAFSRSVDLMRSNPEGDDTWDKIDQFYKEARLVNRQVDLGLNYFETLEERYARLAQDADNAEVFTTAFRSSDAASFGGIKRGELAGIMGNSGTGKCFLADTEVLMFDGSIKKVQDIVVGDLVMGNDSTPRKVLNTYNFIDKVYEIKPVKGQSYFVNSEHILSLKRTMKKPTARKDRPTKIRKNIKYSSHPSRMGDTDIFNISVKSWLNESKAFKSSMKGWRASIDWDKKDVKIDPYFLGIWLGDGHKNTSGVTNFDNIVVDNVKKIAAKRNLSIRVKDGHDYFIYSEENKIKKPGKGISKNTLQNDLRFYNLIKNKHIPFDYKVNDRETRMQLLAGLMDSDGCKSDSGYEISQKLKMLAKDILFLARSLGFAAYMKRSLKKCQTGKKHYYWRIFISGDCSQIPVKIDYKKCSPRKQIKNHLVTGINIIQHKKNDRFFGFETDGNHLFLLADFTVVHNSLYLAWMSVQNVIAGKKVLYISTEMDPDRIATRFDSQFSVIGQNQLTLRKEDVWHALRDCVSDYEDKRRLIIKQFPSGTADMSVLRAYYGQCASVGFKPDLLIIDYPGDMKAYSNLSSWDSRFRLLTEIRGFGVEEKHATWVAIHPNRSSKELGLEEFMDETNQGDSFKQFQIFDLFATLNQTSVENKANVGRFFLAKVRNGKSRFSFKIRYHFKDQTLRLEEITHGAYMAEMTKMEDSDTDETETVIDRVSVDKPRFRPHDGEKIG